MQTLSVSVLEHLSRLPEGTPVSAKELLHLGSRAAVDQTLSRLAQRGQLLRAGRGHYVRPLETRFGLRPPDVDKVVQALAGSKGEVVAAHGAAAANSLGLTPQVPLRLIYLTSGRSRQINLGKQKVELRHAPNWQLALPGRPAGDVIRALAWLGEAHAAEALQTLRQRLPVRVLQEIAGARHLLPTWLAEQVSRWVVNG